MVHRETLYQKRESHQDIKIRVHCEVTEWAPYKLTCKNIANDILLMLYIMFLLPVNFVVFTMNKIMFCSNAV